MDLPALPSCVVRVGDLGAHYSGMSPRYCLYWYTSNEELGAETRRAEGVCEKLTALGFRSKFVSSIHVAAVPACRVICRIQQPLTVEAAILLQELGAMVEGLEPN